MEGLSWTLPEGWSERPGEGMRYATLLVPTEAGGEPLEIRVTPLMLAAQDPLANVNRWREQIGLEHIGPEALSDVARSIEIAGRKAHLVNLEGATEGDEPAQQILAAILPGDQRAWFFMAMDTSERVSPVASQFATFLESVEVVAAEMAGEMPPGHPPLSDDAGAPGGAGMAQQGPSLSWTTPDGWQQRDESNPSRLATLDVDVGGSRAEVAITRFPGNVGGLLPNVNRWRNQLGLAPIQDLSALERPLEDLQVDGTPSQLLDLVGSGEAPQRMLVVLVPRDDFTYFVKMTGPDALVGTQREIFTQFARSLRFDASQS
jgi:hypothetical protein